MKIYLAGSVPKGDKEDLNYSDWRKEYFYIISQHLADAELLDANDFSRLEGDTKAVFGADCIHIRESDLVVVNAEEKLGAGTSMELVIAKYFGRPVITVLPKGSHHRRSQVAFAGREVEDWIHPFIDSFSDVIIEHILEIQTAIEKLNKKEIKTISIIEESMSYAESVLKKV